MATTLGGSRPPLLHRRELPNWDKFIHQCFTSQAEITFHIHLIGQDMAFRRQLTDPDQSHSIQTPVAPLDVASR
jgi:hypothetical protein